MIHPATELRFINEAIGFGVFATDFLPKGTITYAKDPLEIEVAPREFITLAPSLRQVVEKYSYIDERGMRVLSWDHGKFVNHCCRSNTMSTGYGFEIAIRDIPAGEEITDEYGLFNLPEPMAVACSGGGACRGLIAAGDVRLHRRTWDRQVRSAIRRIRHTPQPLWDVLDRVTQTSVNDYLDGLAKYRSVGTLEHVISPAPGDGTKAPTVAA